MNIPVVRALEKQFPESRAALSAMINMVGANSVLPTPKTRIYPIRSTLVSQIKRKIVSVTISTGFINFDFFQRERDWMDFERSRLLRSRAIAVCEDRTVRRHRERDDISITLSSYLIANRFPSVTHTRSVCVCLSLHKWNSDTSRLSAGRGHWSSWTMS